MPARPDHHPFADRTDRDGAAGDHRPIAARPVAAGPVAARPIARRPVEACPASPSGRPGHDLRHVATTHESDGDAPPVGLGADGSTTPRPRPRAWHDEQGSVATEYGLLAVVAATIVSVLLEWATGGGITSLLSAVLARVSELVGL